MGRYSRYWEMRQGNTKSSREVFKCTDCGAVSEHAHGHNGEPNPGLCSESCSSKAEDWKPGFVTRAYRENYDRIFCKKAEGKRRKAEGK